MKIKIIYGSEGGTTHYVAGLIQKKLTELGHQVELHHTGMQSTSPDITGYDLLIFGSPTYYSGQLENKMGDMITTFAPDLSTYKVAVFSLGDSNYPHFCGSAEILESWIAHQNGKLSLPTLKINGYPSDTTEILQWVEKLSAL